MNDYEHKIGIRYVIQNSKGEFWVAEKSGFLVEGYWSDDLLDATFYFYPPTLNIGENTISAVELSARMVEYIPIHQ